MNVEVSTRAGGWTMKAPLRKLVLTAHVSFSVGWLGAVAGFLVLSIAGLTSQNPGLVRGAYLATNLVGGFLIVPMSLGALATGLFQGLGTKWGLFRYYWVFVKFALTVVASLLLLLHQFTAVAEAADRASRVSLPDTRLHALGIQLVFDASLAIVVLLAATVLSIYKPWGLMGYGRRKQLGAQLPGGALVDDNRRSSLKVVLAVGLILAAFVALHVFKDGLGHHGQ